MFLFIDEESDFLRDEGICLVLFSREVVVLGFKVLGRVSGRV